MLDHSCHRRTTGTIWVYRNSVSDAGHVSLTFGRTDPVQSDSPYDHLEQPPTYPPTVLLPIQDTVSVVLRSNSIESPLSPTVRDFTASHIQLDPPHVVAYGGFSDIYTGKCSQVSGVTKVAIKLLRALTANIYDEEKARKRLLREVRVWDRLEHLNIAHFYGVTYQINRRPAIVMQWYKNGVAPDYLRSHPDADKLELIIQVADGLSYLHSLEPPIVHGDLKGNNVLITDNGDAVLSDFGLAKIMEEIAPSRMTTNNIVGSLRWQAPELINAAFEFDEVPILTPKSDVWSFGCTAYELLTEKFPHAGRRTDLAVIQDITQGSGPATVEEVADIREAAGFKRILLSCWSLKPSDRPAMSTIAMHSSIYEGSE